MISRSVVFRDIFKSLSLTIAQNQLSLPGNKPYYVPVFKSRPYRYTLVLHLPSACVCLHSSNRDSNKPTTFPTASGSIHSLGRLPCYSSEYTREILQHFIRFAADKNTYTHAYSLPYRKHISPRTPHIGASGVAGFSGPMGIV